MKPNKNKRTTLSKINRYHDHDDRELLKQVAVSLPLPQRREYASPMQAVWSVLLDVKPRKKRRREK